MAEAAKPTRAKKGEGPYTLAFVDSANKDTPRIPAEVHSIKVLDKASNKAKTYAVAGLAPATLHQLAADGLKRRLDAFIRNSIGGEKTALVLADEMYADIKSGKLYKKAEGKAGAGRTFNFDLWVAAIERTAVLRNKKDKKTAIATEKQLASVRTKLESATSADRKVLTGNWMKDPIFALAKKQVDAEMTAKTVKSDGETNALADLF